MSSGRSSARSSAAASGVLLASAVLSAVTEEPAAGEPLTVLRHPLPDLCPIHRATGHNCPGCGMARAFVLLWRGQLREAIKSNPLSPIVFIAFICLAIGRSVRPSKDSFVPTSVLALDPTGVSDT
jgi:hypothetical protein